MIAVATGFLVLLATRTPTRNVDIPWGGRVGAAPIIKAIELVLIVEIVVYARISLRCLRAIRLTDLSSRFSKQIHGVHNEIRSFATEVDTRRTEYKKANTWATVATWVLVIIYALECANELAIFGSPR